MRCAAYVVWATAATAIAIPLRPLRGRHPTIQRGDRHAQALRYLAGSRPAGQQLSCGLNLTIGQLAFSPSQASLALEWLQGPELRRRVQIGLNKGEAKNALARAVFFNRLGELRDRTFEKSTLPRQRLESGRCRHRAMEHSLAKTRHRSASRGWPLNSRLGFAASVTCEFGSILI